MSELTSRPAERETAAPSGSDQTGTASPIRILPRTAPPAEVADPGRIRFGAGFRVYPA